MLATKQFSVSLILTGLAMLTATAAAQENVRYYKGEDGQTYRESRAVVQRQQVQTEMQAREQTVYREQVSTTIEPRSRTVYTPVTTYEWQARWHDKMNPFKPAYMGYQLVPKTQWQARVEHVDTPVTRRQMVPQRQVVDVPVTTLRNVDEEVIRRQVVRPGTGTAVARREVIGGVGSLESDPPRDGTNWRPAVPQ
ncbi:MAG: hypothetical protein WBF93_14685 [Pirellulales bacterium]|nr:hypothetical protein [Pirellulales bacterium]